MRTAVALALAVVAVSGCTPTCRVTDAECLVRALVVERDGKALELTTVNASALTALWPSTAASPVFAVGAKGTIVRFDGTAWTAQVSGTTQKLNGVWGSAPADVWAVGAGGTILHYDGAAWSPSGSGVSTTLEDVSGTSASDVWAVGEGGVVLHYDGSTWSRATSGTSNDVYGVWAASPGAAWAVATGSQVLRWNGSDWALESTPLPPGEALTAVGGSSASDVWAGGSRGWVAHFDGAAWTARPVPSGDWVRGLSAPRDGEAWATSSAGNRLLHWRGGAWEEVSLTPSFAIAEGDVWAPRQGDAFAVGANAVHFNGSTWTKESLPPGAGVLSDVWGFFSAGSPAPAPSARLEAPAREGLPLVIAKPDSRVEVTFAVENPGVPDPCVPSFCFRACPPLLSCSTKAVCTRATKESATTWRVSLGFKAAPASDAFGFDLLIDVLSDPECTPLPSSLPAATVLAGTGVRVPVELGVRVEGTGGGAGGGTGGGGGGVTCTGGWLGSSRSCGAAGTSDPCVCAGATDVCIDAADFRAATGLTLPAACAPEGATGCVSGTGALAHPCCPGLSCVYRERCGAPAAATNGQCMRR